MRLGEILVADGLVLDADVQRLLAAQRRHHRRIGHLLIAAGLVTADAVARGLSRQHAVPAALQKHLDGRDASLLALIAPADGRRLGALPIARSRDGSVVICLRDPAKASTVDALGRMVGARVVPAVASDAVLLPLIEACYGSADDDDIDVDFDDGDDGTPTTAAGGSDVDGYGGMSGEFTLARLDDVGVARDFTQSSPAVPPPRRPSAEIAVPRVATAALPGLATPRTITDSALTASSVSLANAARVAVETARAAADARAGQVDAKRVNAAMQAADDAARMAMAATMPGAGAGFASTMNALPVAPPPAPTPAPPAGISLADAVARIAVAANRDDIADAAVAFGRTIAHAALVLVIRDGAALGHRGFGPDLTPTSIDAITLPLTVPSVIKQVVDAKVPFVGAAPDLGPLQERFLRLFGGRDLAVVPVAIGTRVVCVVALRPRAAPEIAELGQLATAMADAFGRLIRDGKRPGTQA